ncbi:MAG: hypothetical protein Q8S15_05200 [Erysipelotrichaceae bacterium]|jgi:hypothetical protein|nr:hypothetical protein [Erysipelotrichaceae bacterium]
MISATVLLGYVAVAAGIAAIIKILFSANGRISIPGMTAQWGN